MSGLAGKTAIAGIGQTELSKDSGRTEMRLAVEASALALARLKRVTGHGCQHFGGFAEGRQHAYL